jgi:hypothetical protein
MFGGGGGGPLDALISPIGGILSAIAGWLGLAKYRA